MLQSYIGQKHTPSYVTTQTAQGLRHGRGEQGGTTTTTTATRKSMRGYVAALSFAVFTNSGKRYFSPGSTQPFQKASHQAHLALTQVAGFQAIPSPVRKSTSKLLVLQVAGHNSPQLHFFSLSATFLLTTFLLITSDSCLSFSTGRFSDRQAASHLYRQASLSQISNTAVIT